MQKVKNNDLVKVHYIGKLQDGQVFDSSREREPIEFNVGEGRLIPGFEKAVEGMSIGEKKEFTVSSEQAYGEMREELVQEIDSNHLPQDLKPEVGMRLISKTPDGQENPVVITEVKDDSVVIDANHPLAGKDLVFEIEVMEIAS